MNNCGTCKHWDQEAPKHNWRFSLGLKLIEGETRESKFDANSPYLERVRRVEQSYGQCKLIDLLSEYEERDESELPQAFTKDASDYQATLYTRAGFGCVLHEAKEE